MKKTLKKMDKTLLILMIIYTILGLVMIFSASSITAVLYNHLSESHYFKKQLLVVIVTWLVGIFFFLRFPTKKYKNLAPIGMIGILAALILLIPYGQITNSAKSWYNLGFYNFQPSEFFKPIIVVYLGVYFDKLVKRRDFSTIKILFPFLLILVGFLFVALQPDYGTAFIIAGIAGIIFLMLPINTQKMKNTKLLCVLAGVIGLVGMFTMTLNVEQASRMNFKAPCTRYSQKTGYQVCNGMIAISNGGLFGVGLGNSTQKYLYLPEAHTDFIFPIVCEELGAIVGAIIILGYLVMLIRLLQIARKSTSVRGYIIAYGTFAFILLHLLVNFMGILALIPLTGVPVPFLSYGGSFYLCLVSLLFVCQRVAIETSENKTKEFIRNI